MIMGAIDRILRRGRLQDGGYKPLMKLLEAAMFAACRASGASAWYVPDDFLTLGPELITNGAFERDTSWTKGTGWSIGAGSANAAASTTAANPGIYQTAVPLFPGRTVLWSIKASLVSGTATLRVYGAGGSDVLTSLSTAGTFSGIYTVRGDVNGMFGISHNAGFTGSIDDISVREILSAKDFQDSAGTLPSYLGGTVGAMLDGGYGLEYGPELVLDTAFDNPSAWSLSQPTAGAVSIAGGALSISSTDGSYCQAAVYPFVAAVIGRTVEFVVEVTAASGGGVAVTYGGAVSPAYTTPGIYRGILTATSASPLLIRRASGVASSGTVTSLSVRERKGNHVTQATAGNRPIVTRIPRKLGPELVTNGDFSNGTSGWGTVTASINVSDGMCSITVLAPASRTERTVALVAGKTYVASARILSSSTVAGQLSLLRGAEGGYAAIGYANTVAAGGGGVSSLTFTAPASDAFVQVRNNSGLTSGTVVTDDVSIREVLEWSYALTFDGNDSLAAPASIIGTNLSQPYTMISWGRVGTTTFNRYMQGDSARALGISAALKPTLIHSGMGGIYGSTTLQQGQMVIIEAAWDGATSKIYLNGVLDASGSHAAPTLAPTAHSIGQFGNAGNYWNEAIGGCVVCSAVMTEAQRHAVRKFAAAQMGLVL